MLAKLLALIAQAKAAGVTIVVIAGAATATVAGTTPAVQDQIHQITNNIAQLVKNECDTDRGQPAAVAQRNSANKLLRAAWQTDHKALEDLRSGKVEGLRGGKDVDSQAVGLIVKKYDGLLSERLDKGINDVAALTLGREGQLKASASLSGSPDPSASPTPAASPNSGASVTCASVSAVASPKASPAAASPSPAAAGSPAANTKPEQGRVTVAERTTLEAATQSIVDLAINDMKDLVKTATDEAAKVPAPERGKPSDKGKATGHGSAPDKP